MPSQNCPPGVGSLIAQVQDQCTSCPPPRFNLPYIVWAHYLAVNPEIGSVPVSYRRVECNPPGTIVVDLTVRSMADVKCNVGCHGGVG